MLYQSRLGHEIGVKADGLAKLFRYKAYWLRMVGLVRKDA